MQGLQIAIVCLLFQSKLPSCSGVDANYEKAIPNVEGEGIQVGSLYNGKRNSIIPNTNLFDERNITENLLTFAGLSRFKYVTFSSRPIFND